MTYKELRERRRIPLYRHIPDIEQQRWKDFAIDVIEIAVNVVGLRNTLDNHSDQDKYHIRLEIDREEKALGAMLISLLKKEKLIK